MEDLGKGLAILGLTAAVTFSGAHAQESTETQENPDVNSTNQSQVQLTSETLEERTSAFINAYPEYNDFHEAHFMQNAQISQFLETRQYDSLRQYYRFDNPPTDQLYEFLRGAKDFISPTNLYDIYRLYSILRPGEELLFGGLQVYGLDGTNSFIPRQVVIWNPNIGLPIYSAQGSMLTDQLMQIQENPNSPIPIANEREHTLPYNGISRFTQLNYYNPFDDSNGRLPIRVTVNEEVNDVPGVDLTPAGDFESIAEGYLREKPGLCVFLTPEGGQVYSFRIAPDLDLSQDERDITGQVCIYSINNTFIPDVRSIGDIITFPGLNHNLQARFQDIFEISYENNTVSFFSKQNNLFFNPGNVSFQVGGSTSVGAFEELNPEYNRNRVFSLVLTRSEVIPISESEREISDLIGQLEVPLNLLKGVGLLALAAAAYVYLGGLAKLPLTRSGLDDLKWLGGKGKDLVDNWQNSDKERVMTTAELPPEEATKWGNLIKDLLIEKPPVNLTELGAFQKMLAKDEVGFKTLRKSKKAREQVTQLVLEKLSLDDKPLAEDDALLTARMSEIQGIIRRINNYNSADFDAPARRESIYRERVELYFDDLRRQIREANKEGDVELARSLARKYNSVRRDFIGTDKDQVSVVNLDDTSEEKAHPSFRTIINIYKEDGRTLKDQYKMSPLVGITKDELERVRPSKEKTRKVKSELPQTPEGEEITQEMIDAGVREVSNSLISIIEGGATFDEVNAAVKKIRANVKYETYGLRETVEKIIRNRIVGDPDLVNAQKADDNSLRTEGSYIGRTIYEYYKDWQPSSGSDVLISGFKSEAIKTMNRMVSQLNEKAPEGVNYYIDYSKLYRADADRKGVRIHAWPIYVKYKDESGEEKDVLFRHGWCVSPEENH